MMLLQVAHLMNERGERFGRGAKTEVIGVQGDFIRDDLPCGIGSSPAPEIPVGLFMPLHSDNAGRQRAAEQCVIEIVGSLGEK